MTDPRTILAVTGTRAEFGLLAPVLDAMLAQPGLRLRLAVTGTHLLRPQPTRDDVARRYAIDVEYPMQAQGESGRLADAMALGRGVTGAAEAIERCRPECVLVLGDRIEAFAAASAAAIAGVRVAHIHGGDRAEGIADESMRHAISKLAHIHFAASAESGERLRRMGELPERIRVVGSPAIDGLEAIPPLDDARYDELGRPEIVALLHPIGRDADLERRDAAALLAASRGRARTLALEPNRDPGHEGIRRALDEADVQRIAHLPRPQWIGLLRRVRLLVGNSSAGLIEAAALRLRVLDVGDRQAGRERPANVLHVDGGDAGSIERVLREAFDRADPPASHPYGDGRAGERIAEFLASDAFARLPIAKRNAY